MIVDWKARNLKISQINCQSLLTVNEKWYGVVRFPVTRESDSLGTQVSGDPYWDWAPLELMKMMEPKPEEMD